MVQLLHSIQPADLFRNVSAQTFLHLNFMYTQINLNRRFTFKFNLLLTHEHTAFDFRLNIILTEALVSVMTSRLLTCSRFDLREEAAGAFSIFF
jgi:hypothetical protein